MQIQLINLDRSTDRLLQFRETNSHLTDVVRVPGAEGALAETSKLVENGIIAADLGYSTGALGCALSHISLWRSAATEQRVMTIAEDDTIFSHTFERKSSDLMAQLPSDWDIVTWGYGLQTFLWAELMPGVSAAELRWDGRLLSSDSGIFQGSSGSTNLFKLLHQFGTICYSVSGKGAKLLLEKSLPLSPGLISFVHFNIRTPNEGIDCAMCGIYPQLKAFVAIPPLVVPNYRLPSTIR